MRLFFPNGEHSDTHVEQGDIGIGSAPDNKVVLSGEGIHAYHATLSVDSRGYTLSVLDPTARAHVNARPVREKAILRLGDVLSIDTVQLMLKPDRDDVIRTAVPATKSTPTPETNAAVPTGSTLMRNVPPKVVLRGVSGTYFGKIIPVRGRLSIGRGSDCDLVLDEQEMSRNHAMIENSGDGIYLRDLGSANGTFVNGVQVRDAVLHPGDQIAFDRNRFLLEAPGLPLRAEVVDLAEKPPAPNITQTMQAVRLPEASKPAAQVQPAVSRGEIWWLIIAAACIGLAIALLLLVKF